jgi:RNA polymerase sigma-70 factor (ECF subfamily)
VPAVCCVSQVHSDVLRSAAGGDDRALWSLVRLHHDRVYRYGLRACRDSDDADDAVQQAFIQLARRPDVWADRGALAWLLRVVRNACLRLLRPLQRTRRSLGEPLDAPDATSPLPDPEAALQRWQLVRAVHAAIAELEPAYREVLVLRDLEGLSGDEAARMLRLPLATLKTRLHRARALLRERLL